MKITEMGKPCHETRGPTSRTGGPKSKTRVEGVTEKIEKFWSFNDKVDMEVLLLGKAPDRGYI